MDPTKARLAACFTKVFPNLRPEQVAEASVDGVAEWDSLATLNLLALIEEEFGIIIDLDELSAPSFESLLGRIQRR